MDNSKELRRLLDMPNTPDKAITLYNDYGLVLNQESGAVKPIASCTAKEHDELVFDGIICGGHPSAIE